MKRYGRGWLVAAWLGGAGCVQVPEELDLELDEDPARVYVAAREAEPSTRTSPDSPLPWPSPDHRDYLAWPLEEDPLLARAERRRARTHPLWPTPVDEPCPPVALGRLALPLDGGPTFERLVARMAELGRSSTSARPAAITLLDDHLDVPGLRLWNVSDTTSVRMAWWWHDHCFTTATAAFCAVGGPDELERLVRALGLGPRSLTRAGWLELAVITSGVERVVLEPRLVGECTHAVGVEALAPAVEVDDARVTVRFTAITEGRGVDHTVIVEHDGRVRVESVERWTPPDDSEPWAGVVGSPAAR